MNGSDLKEWRQRIGYTQTQLQLELDVTRQTISGWENGGSPLPRIVELALKALERHPELRNVSQKKQQLKQDS